MLFEISSTKDEKARESSSLLVTRPAALSVLVAEDDPINMKLLKKRLEKAGHTVSHALNGEDCATVYEERSRSLDVILMDMQVSDTVAVESLESWLSLTSLQMPIVDGLSSTKMIRALEHSDKNLELSDLARSQNRILIFAVSASLIESQKDTYVEAGFDGWILKPIDFKRLETLPSWYHWRWHS